MPTTINTYLVGAVVTVSGAFTNLAEEAVDPSAVTFKLKEPDGTITVYLFGVDAELVRDDVGEYHVDWLTTQAGEHCYRFEGAGDVQAVNEGQFEVDAGCFYEVPA